MRSGQTLFWNGNTIHCDRIPATSENRLTLMCGLINHKSEHDESEQGNQRSLLVENIRDSLPRQARGYYNDWHSLGESRMAVQTAQIRASCIATKVLQSDFLDSIEGISNYCVIQNARLQESFMFTATAANGKGTVPKYKFQPDAYQGGNTIWQT